MAGRVVQGSIKAGLGPELGFPHLPIETIFFLCFSPRGFAPRPFLHGRASSYPGSDILRSYGTKRANFLTFLRLTFFICKVMDLSLMHEKCHCSSAWHAEGMQRGPALIPPLLAITAFFPALSLPAPVVTCPGLQWGFSVPPHTLGPSFPVGKIRCHGL